MTSRIPSFLGELKRRKVLRVAAVYVAVGLSILGAAVLILEPLGLDSLRPYIVILVLLGFPIALVLAWAYEVGRIRGFQRTRKRGLTSQRLIPLPRFPLKLTPHLRRPPLRLASL